MIRNKFFILFFLIFLFPVLLNAQGNNGRGKCMQPFGISYYLVEGGDEDEWLELYMKWHYPLMQYALDHGSIIEHKLLSSRATSALEEFVKLIQKMSFTISKKT